MGQCLLGGCRRGHSAARIRRSGGSICVQLLQWGKCLCPLCVKGLDRDQRLEAGSRTGSHPSHCGASSVCLPVGLATSALQGTVHLTNLPSVWKVAKQLQIQYAPAIVGTSL